MSSEDKKQSQTWATSEGFSTLDEYAFFIFDALALLLNTSLNIFVIASVLDQRFLYAYGLSFLILFTASYLLGRKIQTLSGLHQKERLAFHYHMLKMWPNLTVDNLYNRNLWETGFKDRHSSLSKAGIQLATFRQILSSSAMILSASPVLVLLVYLFQTQSSTAALLVLAATLPRQVQILQTLYDLSQHLMAYRGAAEKMQGLLNSLKPQTETLEELLSRIRFPDLTLENEGKRIRLTSFQDVLEQLKLSSGRWTLRGVNGSGKSTLFYGMKKTLGSVSFYLPAKEELIFQSLSQKQGLSTGQKLFVTLEEINQFDPSRVYLLDEWDANLDGENRKKCDQLIQEIAKRSLVFEILHD